MKRILASLLMVGLGARVACADVWDDLAKYKMSDEAAPPPVQINKLIVETPVTEYGAIEDKLIAVVESKDSTPEAKWFSCRMLQRVGTDKCVPVLEKLLCDDIMSHYARLTLERMKDSDKAGEALRAALGKAPDKLKGGIASSLGERRDTKAVKAIAKLAESTCSETAKSALIALGKIGGKDVSKALGKANVCDEAKSALQDARLECAFGLKDVGTFESIYKDAKCEKHRAAALRGLLISDESKGASVLADVIKGDESYLCNAALRFVVTEGGCKITAAVAASLADMPADRQAALIKLLGKRGDKSALGSVVEYMTAEDKAVSDAAIVATGLLGDAGTVKELLALSSDKHSEVLDSLASMTDPDVNAALVAALKEDNSRKLAIEALAARKAKDVVSEIEKLIGDSNADVRKAAWSALGILGGQDDLAVLMELTLAAKEQSDMKAAKACMKEVCSRVKDKSACVAVLGANYEKADQGTKGFILDVAAIAGGSDGLVYVKSALQSDNKELYMNAVRALAAWSDASASDDLLDLARNASEESARILALRGYIQQIANEENKKKQIEKLNVAKELVKRVDEKRLLVSVAAASDNKEVLPFICAFIDDAEVMSEARTAIIEHAKRYERKKNAPEELISALNVIVNDPDKGMASRAKRMLDGVTKK